MNLLKTLILYIETIVNVFSNALVQTFLVYTTVVLIYKIWIEEQTTNYIPIFVTDVLSKLNKTYNEINYGRQQYAQSNYADLENKYQLAESEESIIHKKNKAHNQQVIHNALKMSVGILIVFILFTLITQHFSVHIHWYQLLLSAAITVVGTSYEYFFITQIAVKYNYIKLTELYDNMVDKVEILSQNVMKSDMIGDLEQIVNNSDLNNNNIADYVPTNMLHNAIKDRVQETITNRVNDGIALDNIHNNNITMNNIIQQMGNSMNDTELSVMKNNVV